MQVTDRIIAGSLAFALAFFPALASAQSPVLPGFPPGVFQSRAAIDAALVPTPMKTPILAVGAPASSNPSTASTQFTHFVSGTGDAWTGSNNHPATIGIAGTISSLDVRASSTLSAGQWTITLFHGLAGAAPTTATSLTCVITAGSCTSSATVSIAAGDTVTWQAVPATTPTTTGVLTISAVFTSTNNGESFLMAQPFASPSTSVVNFTGFTATTYNATEANVSSIMPTAGTIDNLYANVSAASGAGKSWVLVVDKNGVAQSVTCTMANTTSCNSVGGTNTPFTVAAGDLVSISVTPSGTPTGGSVTASVRFVPTIPGEAVIFSNGATVPSTTVADFFPPSGTATYTSSGESAFQTNTVPIASTFRKIAAAVQTAPGGATSRAVNLRANLAAPGSAPTCTITGAATSCVDVSGNTYSASIADEIDIQTVPSGTNSAAGYFKTGLVVTVP